MGCHRMKFHTILLAARHKRAHPALIPASEGWYSIYLPQRDGRLSWPRCPDYAPAGIEPRTAWSKVRRQNCCATKTPSTWVTVSTCELPTSQTQTVGLPVRATSTISRNVLYVKRRCGPIFSTVSLRYSSSCQGLWDYQFWSSSGGEQGSNLQKISRFVIMIDCRKIILNSVIIVRLPQDCLKIFRKLDPGVDRTSCIWSSC